MFDIVGKKIGLPFKFQIGDLVDTRGWRDERFCIVIEQIGYTYMDLGNRYKIYSCERMDVFWIREHNLRLVTLI